MNEDRLAEFKKDHHINCKCAGMFVVDECCNEYQLIVALEMTFSRIRTLNCKSIYCPEPVDRRGYCTDCLEDGCW